MKKSIILLCAAMFLVGCGSNPRDPVQESISAIGREADRREQQQSNRDEFHRRLQYQKKRDTLGRVAESYNRPAPRAEFNVPDRSPAKHPPVNPFGSRNFGN